MYVRHRYIKMASRNDSIFSLIPFPPLSRSCCKARQHCVWVWKKDERMITVWARFRATSGPQMKKNKRSRPMLLAQYPVVRDFGCRSLSVEYVRVSLVSSFVQKNKKTQRKLKKSFLPRESRAGQPLPHAKRKKEANGHHELSIPYRSRLGSLHDPPALVDSFHRLACRERERNAIRCRAGWMKPNTRKYPNTHLRHKSKTNRFINIEVGVSVSLLFIKTSLECGQQPKKLKKQQQNEINWRSGSSADVIRLPHTLLASFYEIIT